MTSQKNYWLVISTDHRAHGGNDGYNDDLKVQYEWDSTVKHHSRVCPGDTVVFWNKNQLLGASEVTKISTKSSNKDRYRCPTCMSTRIKKRSIKTPTYRCQEQDCKFEFNNAIAEVIEVTNYMSKHSEKWIDLFGLLEGAELRKLCDRPRAQDSLRYFNFSKFLEVIRPRVSISTWQAISQLAS